MEAVQLGRGTAGAGVAPHPGCAGGEGVSGREEGSGRGRPGTRESWCAVAVSGACCRVLPVCSPPCRVLPAQLPADCWRLVNIAKVRGTFLFIAEVPVAYLANL